MVSYTCNRGGSFVCCATAAGEAEEILREAEEKGDGVDNGAICCVEEALGKGS